MSNNPVEGSGFYIRNEVVQGKKWNVFIGYEDRKSPLMRIRALREGSGFDENGSYLTSDITPKKLDHYPKKRSQSIVDFLYESRRIASVHMDEPNRSEMLKAIGKTLAQPDRE